MRRCLIVGLGLLALGLALSSTLDSWAQDNKTLIRVRGSDSVAGRVDQLAKLYMKDHPEVNVVVLGGAKTIGLPALIDKSGEVAMAARKATDLERREANDHGIELVERLIGYGGLTIIVDQENPINELTIEQVQKILKGEFNRWDQVNGSATPITVFSVGEIHQGTIHFLENDFLGKAPITKKAEIVSGFETLIRKVAETKGSVGFTRIRDAFESPASQQVQFKILKLKETPGSPAIFPSRDAIADGSYPLKRPFFLYLDTKAKPEVKAFVDFIVGKGWGAQKL
ncbi:MAG: PstS family phosphate ABC transporter substrate-binding protein [Desulfomonile tiedjei]|nr:PstS family phosphate ABC transporter substrate-binding protein [Desulfomonile tiedjei]